ncbi:MAG: hypothetical protein ABJB12_16965, partial [Pseudomonadota bacterium]
MDPSVRDDGDLEPDLQLTSETASTAGRTEDSVLRAAGDGAATVRERLLARAQAARQGAVPEDAARQATVPEDAA